MARGRGVDAQQQWAPLRTGGVLDPALAPSPALLEALTRAIGVDAPVQYRPAMEREDAFEYSANILVYGAGMQPGDHLVIEAREEAAELAAISAINAYQNGATRVTILTDDVDSYTELMEGLGVPANIASSASPGAWESALEDDATFLTINDRPSDGGGARNAYWDAMDQNKVRWSLAYWPTPSLARSVYGDDPDAEVKLGRDLRHFMRCGDNDSPGEMKTHLEKLYRRSAQINKLGLKEIIIENGDGDCQASFGLLETSRFSPCHWSTESGKPFGCNVPTEEVFCTPDPTKTNGKFRSVRPTKIMGLDIMRIEGEFKNGELQRENLRLVTSDPSLDPTAAADQVYRYLKTNPGMLQVGELALIGADSRIAESGRVYGIDNLDENIGCHFALGDSYVAGLEDHQDDPRRNRAGGHIDITFADQGTQIYGVTQDGRKIQLMADGEWRGPLR